jgi:4-amino-4-deoxy-L-arabinose transferase-like glycosyltransferase
MISPWQQLKVHDKSLVALFVLTKLLLLYWLPLTGDEAYFITWGQDLSWGYYDHPPVVGWIIYLLGFINDHYFFYRLFAFVVSIVIAVLIYKLACQHKDKETSLLVALVFFVSPLSLLVVLLTNDVVLLLFGFFGFYFFSQALRYHSIVWAVFASIFLGLAFLSKYFAVLLFAGVLSYLLFNYKKTYWKITLIGVLVISVFIAENIFYNMNNCWDNIIFNLVSRTDGNEVNLNYVWLFLFSFLFVVPPFALFGLRKIDRAKTPNVSKQALYISFVFLLCFFALSFYKRIGLHWFILFLPFAYLLFAHLKIKMLKFLLRYNSILSILIGLALVILFSQYGQLLKSHKNYPDAVFVIETAKVCPAFNSGAVIYTLDYTVSSTLAYFCKDNTFHEFLNRSKYGREDDKNINYRELDGTNLEIFVTYKSEIERFKPYFSALNIFPVAMEEGVTFYKFEGVGFNYLKYRKKELSLMADEYYARPDWLPVPKCGFKEKYAL